VRLLESEVHFSSAGARVFSVAAEGRAVATNVDIFARVGRNAADEITFEVPVTDGTLDLTFTHHRNVAKVDALIVTPLASTSAPAGPGSGRPFADASTPRYDLVCTQAWGPCPLGRGVPIPAGATPSPGYDANMVVLDWSTRTRYEFWQYRSDRRTVSWGEVGDIDGDGRRGAVGAGVSRLAGLVRTYEIRAGVVEHALVGPTGNSCREFRYPATKSDGWSTADGCIPEGARVQLDPAVDCAGLAAPQWEKIVCRTLQTYGWYNIDNAGPQGSPGFSIQFENPAGEPDPYPAAGLAWDYMRTSAIPLSRLRVLAAWDS
jgi:hypothetical protein